jgi:hypothetical protein
MQLDLNMTALDSDRWTLVIGGASLAPDPETWWKDRVVGLSAGYSGAIVGEDKANMIG